MKTYCLISCESGGETWDYGAYSVFSSLSEALKAVAGNHPTRRLNATQYAIKNPYGAFTVTLTPDLTREQCELFGNFEYPTC